jgi:hypothetical protein
MTDLLNRLQTALGDAYRIERELGGGGMSRVFEAVEQGCTTGCVRIRGSRPGWSSSVVRCTSTSSGKR